MSETSNGGTPNATSGYLVSDLVGLALEQLGVGVGGQNTDPQGLASGVMHLNMMLAQWQRKRWLVPNLVDKFCLSTGASVYAVGPGGDFDMPVRPAQVLSAYARLLTGAQPSHDGDFSGVDFNSSDFDTSSDGLSTGNPVDYPLMAIPSYEDYASLGLKGLKMWPNCFFYNPAFPAGELRPWPIPPAQVWELHIIVAECLPTTLKAMDAINLPPEYWDAIMWILAARMAPSYGQEASATVATMARGALATIRSANVQIPTLGMPAILTPINNPFYWPGLEIQKL
ncbi:hypothetical protein [Gluconobacter roseus]|uniref:Uncharacterized protein n=1 Tax=Gluconobacter roseus NBRC 3990 TaxID=1307950 RepID=A0A4Y3M5R0_9PROT|nr:hypothetical protein [Gluconobacter roseus]KXV43065.1 hypothetical protein AD943_08745 [Gluconobacter roseus]GBR43360.1 hypothetical protein AA3990_0400 [Gluconobacter roseus NBRC 3990]GEB03933.1 hypothetical protein GRO01_15090 [Gluconobacter roseus NBRC 3990]GLP94386.1 hypothetical protein GCM10007871_23640 [Gluconobacter roseus NBRC 3990]